MKTAGIYCFKCLKNGKVYVGQSIDVHARQKQHLSELSSGKKSGKWQGDWNRWGAESFEFSILEEVSLEEKYETETEEMKKKLLGWALDRAEKEWIKKLKADSKKCGYNKAPGGNYMPAAVKKKWQKKKSREKKMSKS